jgi:hypothetical protein
MALYLTISEGSSPLQAKPYLVTGDQKLIRVVAGELAKRLGLSADRPVLPLRVAKGSRRDSSVIDHE